MSERPTIDPGAAAALLDAAPDRVRRRLDAEPDAAEAWVWTEVDGDWTVVAGDEQVTLTVGPETTMTGVDAVVCTCLLSPRCFHLLAVVSRLLPTDGDTEDSVDSGLAPGPGPGPGPDPMGTDLTGAHPSDSVPVADHASPTPAQQAAAATTWDAGVRVLLTGLQGSGSLVQAELLRAAHACRQTALPTLGSAAIRVLGLARARAEDRPDFVLAEASVALAELLGLAHVLAGRGRPATADDVGTARRAFHPVGSASLRGLGTEVVVTDTGYAGVVTHLIDAHGSLRSVPDVVPGDVDRVVGAYRSPVRLGTVSIDHRALGRSLLHVQRLSVSSDGRVSGGGGVQAALATDPAWDDPTWAGAWTVPLADQVALGGLIRTIGTVAGRTPDSVVVTTSEGSVHLTAPDDRPELAHRDGLRLLGAAVGLEVRILGRLDPARARTLWAIAVHLAPANAGLLPDEWRGTINLGLDRLVAAHLPPPDPEASPLIGWAGGAGLNALSTTVEAPEPPFDLVSRRAHRMVAGGWSTLGDAAGPAVATDLARLRAAQLGTGADLLAALHRTVLVTTRATTGQRRGPDADAVGRAWLATATWSAAARDAIAATAWLAP